jgi:HEAT repeat protein
MKTAAKSAIPELSEALMDPDEAIRKAAGEALEEIEEEPS